MAAALSAFGEISDLRGGSDLFVIKLKKLLDPTFSLRIMRSSLGDEAGEKLRKKYFWKGLTESKGCV